MSATNKMRRSVSPARAIFCLCIIGLGLSSVSSRGLPPVELFEQDGAHLVKIGSQNYALTSAKLRERGWQAVSVNGDEIVIFTSSGDRITKNGSEDEADQKLIEEARGEIEFLRKTSHKVTKEKSGDGSGDAEIVSETDIRSEHTRTKSKTIHSSGGTSLEYVDENNFSVAKPRLPLNWGRLFVYNDFVTIVYKNGEVIMKPEADLSAEEAEAVKELRVDVARLRTEMKDRMSKISDDVRSSMDNLRSSMESMSEMIRANVHGGQQHSIESIRSYGQPMVHSPWPFGGNPFTAPGWPFGAGHHGGT